MLNNEDVIQLLSEIELSENQQRKRYAYDSFQIHDGNLRYYVQEKMKLMYPMTWNMFQVSDYSALKKIVDKKSKAYKENPIRKLQTPEESLLYQDIVKKYNLNKAMKKFDQYFNQHKYTLMAVFFERKDVYGKIEDAWKFIPLAPYEFDVVLDEMGELQTVVLSYPDTQVVSGPSTDGIDTKIAGAIQDANRDHKTYAVWTKEQHIVYSGVKHSDGSMRFERVIAEGNPNGVNPYGVIPFVYVPEEYSQDYPVNSPLASQTIELNAEMSTYYTSGSLQIGTLVLKYPSSQAIESVANGMFTGMKLPQSENPEAPETTAEFISPSPNMSGHREAIITHMQAILDEQGINSNQIVQPNEKFVSGFDRLLASADVQDIIADNQQNIYQSVEMKIYNIIRTIYKNFIKKDLFSSDELTIIYSKPRVMISDTEKLANIEKMDQLGLISPWEKFMLMDPNLSEEDAKAKYDEIQNFKMKNANDLAGILAPPVVVEEEEEEEEVIPEE
jgi:hypothetical protein